MKISGLLTAVILIYCFTAFAQNEFLSGLSKPEPASSKELGFYVHGKYDRPVNKEKLNRAKLVSDFVDGYPTNWISEYVSMEIVATCNGKTLSAVSTNDKLSAEQKNILNLADLSTDIFINVKYKTRNDGKSGNVDKVIDVKELIMNITLNIIPETEAEFIGGQKQLSEYIKESFISKIPDAMAKQMKVARATFTVNEMGETADVRIIKTSGDLTTDKLIIDAIKNMSMWRPAKNSSGIKVKQNFVLGIGDDGC